MKADKAVEQLIADLRASTELAETHVAALQKDCADLSAKLAAVERACASVRSLAVVLRANHPPEHQAYRIGHDIEERLRDAGRDYVPRSEVDAARQEGWQRGIEEALELPEPHRAMLLRMRDAKPTESAAAHQGPHHQPPETQP